MRHESLRRRVATLLLHARPLTIPRVIWFRVQGSGFRVQGSRFRVQGSGFRVQGIGCRFQGSGCRVQSAGCRVQGSGFRVQGAGFRVQGSRVRVSGFVIGREGARHLSECEIVAGGVEGLADLVHQLRPMPVAQRLVCVWGGGFRV